MRKYFIIFNLIFICFSIKGQIEIKTKFIELNALQKERLNKHLKSYKSFKFDKLDLLNKINKERRVAFKFEISDDFNWDITLELNDLRGPDYVFNAISNSNTKIYNDLPCNTYKGHTKKGEIARFFINDELFNGMILDSQTKKGYFIKGMKSFDENSASDLYVLYEKTDIISPDLYIDDIVVKTKTSNVSVGVLKSAPLCGYYLELATDADFEYYQAKGSNVFNVYNDIMNVLNLIEGVYESTFDLRLVVTFQNVWTSSVDPYISTNHSTLLNEFVSEWSANRAAITRDIAHLFTGKDLDGSVAGVGYMPGDYSISMNRTEMFETTAHEIGHNLDSDHPSSANQSSCQCGSNAASVMCQGTKDNNLWFCQQSVNEISSYLLSQSTTFSSPIPQNLNLSGTVSDFHKNYAREVISSTQMINNGNIIYQADEILLNPGFEVKPNSQFEIIIDDTGCY